MTDTQLSIAIGVPVVVNILFNGTVAMLMSNHFNAQLAAVRLDFNARMDLLEKLLTEKLLRVEQVLDARLKHLEEK
jgi:hypothetical protein